MSDPLPETSTTDSYIGVRDCGCITAWMSMDQATPKEVRDFYGDMAKTGREVRKARLEDIRGRIGRCEHRG